ncbi:hypothetical protein BVY02_00780 [bacterium J17]|nr:hypothetical protein BVY02_00780 [bacterium J17]
MLMNKINSPIQSSRFRFSLTIIFLILLSLSSSSCGSSTDDIIDVIDTELDPPSRKTIDVSRMGVNNFFVNPEFGTIANQYLDIRDNLGISNIRVLFAATNDVIPTPDSGVNFAFFDDVIEAIPAGINVLVVLSHTPDWMADPANWIDGNPRTTWVEKFLRPVVERYSGRPGIIAWEVWNEPDLTVVASDTALGLEDPNLYFDLLNQSVAVIRSTDPSKLILQAATESIQQSFPDKLDYNRVLRDLGAANLIDVWNIHYYGEQFEKVVISGGVADFLGSINKPIWITESGERGPNNQLAYVETAWPFLRDEINGISLIFYYEYGSPIPADINYGLYTTDPAFPVSDLQLFLAGNAS